MTGMDARRNVHPMLQAAAPSVWHLTCNCRAGNQGSPPSACLPIRRQVAALPPQRPETSGSAHFADPIFRLHNGFGKQKV
jgi:hypothetical protein